MHEILDFFFFFKWGFKNKERATHVPASPASFGFSRACATLSAQLPQTPEAWQLLPVRKGTQGHPGTLLVPPFSGGSPPWKPWFWLGSAVLSAAKPASVLTCKIWRYSGKNRSKWLLYDLFPEV